MPVRRWVFLMAALLGLSTVACGFLEESAEQADVTITVDIPAEFTIDGNKICENAGQSYDCENGNYQPAPSDIELDPVEFSKDIDIRDHTERDIGQYTGKFKQITIEQIDYKTENNSLSFDLPETNLHLADFGTDSSDASSAFLLTTLEPISAGANVDRTAPVSSSAQDKASDLFKSLKMSVIPRVTPVIKQGQDIPPHGTADMTMTFEVKFVANPVDAASN
jgi:hypothetical protein